MKATVVRWAPWILVATALGVFLAIPDANGPALVAVWGAIIIVVRFGIGLLPDRTSRLWADAVVILGCILAAFEGGWYLLPAAVAFAIKDRNGPSVAPFFRRLTASQEWVAGLSSCVLGIAGLAIGLWGPLYSSRSAAIASGAIIDGPLSSTSLAAGLTPRAAIVLVLAASLLVAVAVASSIHARTGRRWAGRLLAVATLGLAIIALAGAFTIGALLLPAIALAVFAWVAGRKTTPVSTS